VSGSEAERLARVTLNAVGEPGNLRLTTAVADRGAATVLEELRGRPDDLGHDLAARLRTADPARTLEAADKLGLRFVIPGDPEWPDPLHDLARCGPLHERGGMPLGLWLRGPLSPAVVGRRAVAVVGSRSATTYGDGVAGDLAAGLARAGQTVVSGAAFGIDQAAHRGALATRGPTVAVLACGADRIYPAAHERLLDYIADVGVIVSEAPIGGAPTRIRFLARNRLIAALAQGTVVVEAAIRSGALNTASWAAALGRVVMGVPGPVTSEPSAGVHQLIRGRDALLVTRAEEVLEAVAPIGTHTLEELREEEGLRDRLTAQERQVLDAVPVRQGAPAASIARTAGLAPAKTDAALDRLERLGLVVGQGERWHLAAQVAEPA
jgi:DNA processing protein